jgi:hypothetical protein
MRYLILLKKLVVVQMQLLLATLILLLPLLLTQLTLTHGQNLVQVVEAMVQLGELLRFLPPTNAASTGITVATTNASTGSSGTNANYQPYITVYMWKRTA